MLAENRARERHFDVELCQCSEARKERAVIELLETCWVEIQGKLRKSIVETKTQLIKP